MAAASTAARTLSAMMPVRKFLAVGAGVGVVAGERRRRALVLLQERKALELLKYLLSKRE